MRNSILVIIAQLLSLQLSHAEISLGIFSPYKKSFIEDRGTIVDKFQYGKSIGIELNISKNLKGFNVGGVFGLSGWSFTRNRYINGTISSSADLKSKRFYFGPTFSFNVPISTDWCISPSASLTASIPSQSSGQYYRVYWGSSAKVAVSVRKELGISKRKLALFAGLGIEFLNPYNEGPFYFGGDIELNQTYFYEEGLIYHFSIGCSYRFNTLQKKR